MMLAFLSRIFLVIVGLFVLPLGAHALWWTMRDDIAPSWRAADWSSAKLLPAVTEAPQAIVAIYAARVGRWRGILAQHTRVVVKEAGPAAIPATTRSAGAARSVPTDGRRTAAGSAMRRIPLS